MKSLVMDPLLWFPNACFHEWMVRRCEMLNYFLVGGPLQILDRNMMCFEDIRFQSRPFNSHGPCFIAPFCHFDKRNPPSPQPVLLLRMVLPLAAEGSGGGGKTPFGEKLHLFQQFPWAHIFRVVMFWGFLLPQFQWRLWILASLEAEALEFITGSV